MNSLIIFAKAPRVGEVKTRLLANTPLSPEEVCSLYRAFLCDVLAAAGKCSAQKVIVSFWPADAEPEMAALARESIQTDRLVLHPQSGADFSERVLNSFQHAFSTGAASAVMIGSDSPTIQPKIVESAFAFLAASGGVALGPSGEGGLYLIGLEKNCIPDFTAIFDGSTELLNFARHVQREKQPLMLLEEVTDVDVAQDLVSLISIIAAMKQAARGGGFFYPANTAKQIEELNLHVAQKNGTRNKVIVRGS